MLTALLLILVEGLSRSLYERAGQVGQLRLEGEQIEPIGSGCDVIPLRT
jgi:hypothetical protein